MKGVKQMFSSLEALKSKDFNLLFIGQLTSSIGNSLFRISLFWLVAKMTDDPINLALLGLAMTLPSILSAFNGVFVDRFNRKNIMLLSDLIRLLIVLLLSYLIYINALNVYFLIFSYFVLAYLGNLFETTYMAYYPNTLYSNQINSATGLVQSSYEISNIVAALLGAVILIFSPVLLFLINACTYLVSLYTLIKVKTITDESNVEPKKSTSEEHTADKNLINQLLDGIKFIWNFRFIRNILPPIILSNMMFVPFFTFTSVWSLDILNKGSTGFALLELIVAVAILFGALITTPLSKKISEKHLLVSSLALSISLIVFPMVHTLSVSLISLGIFCIIYGIFNTLIFSFLQHAIPDELRGRAFGIIFSLSGASIPVGQALFGFLINWIGIINMFWVASTLLVVSMYWMIPIVYYKWVETNEIQGVNNNISANE